MDDASIMPEMPQIMHRTPCNLAGKILNISFILGTPYKSELNFEVLKALEYVLNFGYKLKESKEWGGYNEETGEWNGLIQQILTDEADLTVTYAADIPLRRTVIDFTMQVATLKFAAILRKQNFRGDEFALLQPFANTLWLVILSWCFLTASTLYAIQFSNGRLSTSAKQCSEREQIDKSRCLLMTLAILCGRTMLPLPTRREKIVVYTATVVVVVLNSSFTAVLLTFLAVTPFSVPSADEIQSRTFTFAIDADDVFLIEKTTKGAIPSRFVQLYQTREKTGVAVWAQETKENVLRGTWILLATDWTCYRLLQESFNLNEFCSVALSILPFGSQRVGMMLPKNSPYKSCIDSVILKAEEVGINALWKRRYIPRMRAPCGTKRNYEPIALTSVMLTMYVLGAGFFVAMSLLFVEYAYASVKTGRWNFPVIFKEKLVVAAVKLLIRKTEIM